MKNKVQLITYVDRFGGGGLADLQALLAGPLQGVFGGVHLLPFFFPIDGADAAYVCRGQVCGLPVTTVEDLAAGLSGPV